MASIDDSDRMSHGVGAVVDRQHQDGHPSADRSDGTGAREVPKRASADASNTSHRAHQRLDGDHGLEVPPSPPSAKLETKPRPPVQQGEVGGASASGGDSSGGPAPSDQLRHGTGLPSIRPSESRKSSHDRDTDYGKSVYREENHVAQSSRATAGNTQKLPRTTGAAPGHNS